jgi:hypothetical protein
MENLGILENAICDSFFRDVSFDEFEYLEPCYAENAAFLG